MRVYLETLGCRLNYAEMAALGRQLAAAGHELAQSAHEADLCVLNSCAVTGEAARQSRQLARQMARGNPASQLIVTGCYATLESETVSHLPNVTHVVGNASKDDLFFVIEKTAGDREEARPANRATVEPLAGSDAGRTRAFIKVQDGCRNKCTFCIVTVARGEERSRSIPEIVAEIRGLHEEGYQEAVLTGVHLGGYGADLGTGLGELTSAVLAGTRIPRLRLSSLEPFDLQPGFFDLWPHSDGRLMPHLHLPAQSGSDAVLKRMARRNRVADFDRLVDAARRAIPGLTITTDLIVGFPGETEQDFEETVAFAERMGFAHMHVFPFSSRQGTAAASFDGQVAEAERKRRVRVLTDCDRRLGHAARAPFVGQIRPVLWENTIGRYEDGDKDVLTWSGLTDNYLRVRASAPGGVDLRNRISQAHLVGLDGDDLLGTLARLQEQQPMTLEERLDADLKEAMRSGDDVRKLAIRSVKTALTEAKVAGTEQRSLGEEDVLRILQRQVKQRRDSVTEFTKGGRPDLVAKEEAEIAVLEKYLPEQMSEAEIRVRAQAVIAELGVTDQKGMGPVMKRLTADLRGQADGSVVSRIVREQLASQ